MNNINYKVSLAFTALPPSKLLTFTLSVITGMTDNLALANPPVTIPTLTSQQSDYAAKVIAALDGGSESRAARNAAQEVVLASLRQLASYVQTVAGTNLELLLSSGFVDTSSNRASTPLITPIILAIENSATSELRVVIQTVPNAKAYELQYSIEPGVWRHAATYANSRDLLITNLTPGTMVATQIRAIGGSTGRSNWSDPVTHMST